MNRPTAATEARIRELQKLVARKVDLGYYPLKMVRGLDEQLGEQVDEQAGEHNETPPPLAAGGPAGSDTVSARVGHEAACRLDFLQPGGR